MTDPLDRYLDELLSAPQRQQVPLMPGDRPYEWHCGSLAAPGHRWEYDSEFRVRVKAGALEGLWNTATFAENYERTRDLIASTSAPPKWRLLDEASARLSAALRQKIDEYGMTLPPGSSVAVRQEPTPTDVPSDGILRITYTLRPVFPGQPHPGEEWTVYAPVEGRLAPVAPC